ncbi:hypothetical protein HDC90_000139 [Pedobacter sp. AK013]|uniref:hypothetical protein n=1 Tax=Pedobacter sp. AK013 TaxID=2723071 RepID=UPI001609CD71|nr:hypothetical protein [Pedobacter sp. AK013]MBB6235542.1 hypothetical protein [Pedobacter sp. AK013]
MLKQKLKWSFLPVVAIALITGLSAFTSSSEEEVDCVHAKCIEGNSRHCNYRDCTTPKCKKKVESCDVAGFWDSKNCKS